MKSMSSPIGGGRKEKAFWITGPVQPVGKREGKKNDSVFLGKVSEKPDKRQCTGRKKNAQREGPSEKRKEREAS